MRLRPGRCRAIRLEHVRPPDASGYLPVLCGSADRRHGLRLLLHAGGGVRKPRRPRLGDQQRPHVLIDALLLVAVLSAIKLGSRLFALPRTDEIAMLFCGSQKSAITGVPMAHLLFAGPAAGMIVLPIIIYHQLQLRLGAWLARRYASAVIITLTDTSGGPLGGETSVPV
jgi:hypothetical protein